VRQYVILRRPAAWRGAPDPGAAPTAPAEIEVASLDAADSADLRRNPEIIGVAQAFPTNLVRPLGGDDSGGINWGIPAVGADRSQYSGAGVPVAVLDTGIDVNHDAFQGIDLVAKDFVGEGGVSDQKGHGTHCAGIAVGRDVGGVRIGVARGVSKLIAGKILDADGRGSSSMIFDGILWAVSAGARVVSLSVGLDFPGFVSRLVGDGWPSDVATSLVLEAYRDNLRMFDAIMTMVAARLAFDGGAVIVAAAGNESRRNIAKDYSIAAALPAAGTGVIAVGAVAARGDKHVVADFSNSRPAVVAPGVNIRSARFGGGLATLSGTSMACPYVAGIAALWWEAASDHTDSQPDARAVERMMLGAASAATLVDPPELRGLGMVRAPT
jgi:subtilisin family serine protease